MNPLLAFLLPELAKQVPVLVLEVIQLLSKSTVTDADWDALKAKYAGKTYDQYIAASQAPPPSA